MTNLGVTLGGVPFQHLVYRLVLVTRIWRRSRSASPRPPKHRVCTDDGTIAILIQSPRKFLALPCTRTPAHVS